MQISWGGKIRRDWISPLDHYRQNTVSSWSLTLSGFPTSRPDSIDDIGAAAYKPHATRDSIQQSENANACGPLVSFACLPRASSSNINTCPRKVRGPLAANPPNTSRRIHRHCPCQEIQMAPFSMTPKWEARISLTRCITKPASRDQSSAIPT